ncbi:hypothetical protein roselon_01987 [Roseibacterium elongatum DSM 19469]|uniref:Uncharacterized protein n=1 Tax=Roseicyclus elongatus DSM 19469 TaxID=1294273 RepID=W8SP85_9RHOB|nr:hypothetical protein roselon_01987 [Roseibacterium elongatum DSM 19469]
MSACAILFHACATYGIHLSKMQAARPSPLARFRGPLTAADTCLYRRGP